MSSTEEERLDSEMAKLALNAELYRFDPHLDHVADLMDAGDAAWTKLPPIAQDRGSLYTDARAAYRRAVRAGAVADDRRGPTGGNTA